MKDVFVSIIRKSIKYKTYTIINIAGLSVAIALSCLLFLYAYNEYNVDDFHSNNNRIVRVVSAKDKIAFTSTVLAEELKNRFPEIEAVTRVRHIDGGFYKFNNATYDVKYDMCFDSTAFDMFNFNLILGNKKDALQKPFSIVLTEHIAKKIFGNANPVGEKLQYNNICDFIVTGVIKDLPANSTFRIDVILPFHVLEYLWDGNPQKPSNILKERDNESFHTYILFKKNVDIPLIESKIIAFISEKNYGRDYKLQPLSNIYFDKNPLDRWLNKGDMSMVKLLLTIGIGLLLISIINYINLNNAITVNNMFSFGIKKLLGASINQIVSFSVFETILVFSISVVFAICIIAVVKNPFFTILSTNYHFTSLLSLKSVSLAILVIIFIAFLSGIIPVYYIKRFPSISIINKKHSSANSLNPFNKSLLILQFVITIIFIVSTLFISKQVNYIRHRNMGFQKDLLVYVDLKSQKLNSSQTDILKERLLSNPSIKSVSFSGGMFGDIRQGMNFEMNGINVHFRRIHTDPDYMITMGYKLLEGRNFSWNIKTDATTEAYIINKAMADAFKMKNPLKEQIARHQIVGVVENFHFESIHKAIEPVALVCNSGRTPWNANIKLSSNDIQGSIKYIEKTWKNLYPDFPLIYSFADDRIASYYKKEFQFSRLSIIFSIINICISCIGLVGLVLLSIGQRIKEIGIRKVNGAKVTEILAMLNTNFIQWIVIAYIIATPLAWYAMNTWLENFAYKTDLSWWVFILAGTIALVIVLITVSWQSWRAATRNPVEALRYE